MAVTIDRNELTRYRVQGFLEDCLQPFRIYYTDDPVEALDAVETMVSEHGAHRVDISKKYGQMFVVVGYARSAT